MATIAAILEYRGRSELPWDTEEISIIAARSRRSA
jgi:hypothetical protein